MHIMDEEDFEKKIINFGSQLFYYLQQQRKYGTKDENLKLLASEKKKDLDKIRRESHKVDRLYTLFSEMSSEIGKKEPEKIVAEYSDKYLKEIDKLTSGYRSKRKLPSLFDLWHDVK